MAVGDLCYSKTQDSLAYCKRAGEDYGKLIYKKAIVYSDIFIVFQSYNPPEVDHGPEGYPFPYPTYVSISLVDPYYYMNLLRPGEEYEILAYRLVGETETTVYMRNQNVERNPNYSDFYWRRLEELRAVWTVYYRRPGSEEMWELATDSIVLRYDQYATMTIPLENGQPQAPTVTYHNLS